MFLLEHFMGDIRAHRTSPGELSWLLEVAESVQPVDELRPIWVRHGTITSGPPVPHPERHPYCEFGTNLEGRVMSFVEREQAQRLPGDIFLAGPGIPHWAKITKYPLTFISIYFLPGVLVDLGPHTDGYKTLLRFTAPQSLSDRLVRPPDKLRRQLAEWFKEIAAEFDGQSFGSEMRLRALLVEQLVHLLRWEQLKGRTLLDTAPTDWQTVYKILRFIREHYAEPVYSQQIARVVGISESRLKSLFREALGMSWVKYLQGFRIHRAAAMMSNTGCNVTEAGLAVGFESFSHFNATFHSFMGVSPSVYRQRNLVTGG